MLKGDHLRRTRLRPLQLPRPLAAPGTVMDIVETVPRCPYRALGAGLRAASRMRFRNRSEVRSWPVTHGELLKSPAATKGRSRPSAAAAQADIAFQATSLYRRVVGFRGLVHTPTNTNGCAAWATTGTRVGC